MTKPWKGKIAVDIREATPDWEPYTQPTAPEGSPNILMIVWDDVGYGTMDTFGGPVETPNMTRIADSGIRFSNFHTTALCSPDTCKPHYRTECDQQQHGHHRRSICWIPGPECPHTV